MPEPEDAPEAHRKRRISHVELISRAAEALNPQLLAESVWAADVGAAIEATDGQIFTGACIGGSMGVCAEVGAFSQLVAATGPTIARVVAVWRDPADGVLHVIPPCGRCREFFRTMSQQNLEATVIMGSDHTRTLRELLPYAGWHAERVDSRQAEN